MTRHQKTIFALALLLATSLPASALDRAGLIPPEAKVDIRVSNTTNFLAKLKKSSLGKLWADPQFQDFLGHPNGDMLKEILFGEEKTAEGEIMMEQYKMLKGELIVALPKDPDTPYYLIAAMSDEDFRRSLVLDDKMAESAEEPFDIVKSSFQDIDVIEHIEDAGTASESRTWQAFLNNTLVMGPNREWVEKSIVELKKEAISEPEGNPTVDINFPLAAVIDKALQEAKDAQTARPTGVDPTALFESLGLTGIDKLTTHIELKDDEMVADSNLMASSLNKGIFAILDTTPTELPNVGFVPQNISLLEVSRVNLLGLWHEIPTVLSAAMPTVKPQFDVLLATIRQQIGIDVEKDLLAHLGTRYLAFSSLNDQSLISVMALELKDEAAFKRGMESIMNSPAIAPQVNATLDTVDFLDHTLYVGKTTEPDDAFAFAVAGNYLLYGHPDGVRQAIRSLSSETASNTRLEDNELVKGLRRYVPSNAFGFSASDWRKNMAYTIRELTKPQRIRFLQERWAMSGSAFPPPDFEKLPPTGHLASFFNTSYLYLEKTNQGIHQRMILKY